MVTTRGEPVEEEEIIDRFKDVLESSRRFFRVGSPTEDNLFPKDLEEPVYNPGSPVDDPGSSVDNPGSSVDDTDDAPGGPSELDLSAPEPPVDDPGSPVYNPGSPVDDADDVPGGPFGLDPDVPLASPWLDMKLSLTPCIPQLTPANATARAVAVETAVMAVEEPGQKYITQQFFTRDIEARLLATRSSQEFLDIVPDNVLGYMDPMTLRRLTQHLVAIEPRDKVVRRTPYATQKIMEARKKFRNRRSAKKSKAVTKISTNAIKLAFSAIAAEIEANPGIINHFTEETQALINSAR